MNLELQSFVVAAIVAAIFLADRLGGSEQVNRRLYQVALGFALVFVVSAATIAFLRAESASLSDILRLPAAQQSVALLSANDTGDRTREAEAVKAGIGLFLLVGGLAATRRWSTLPLGAALGGLLLLLASGGSSSFNLENLGSSALFSSLLGKASEGRDIAFFVVLLIGTLALAGFGYWRWERAASEPAAQREPTSP